MVEFKFYKEIYFGSSITEQEWPAFSARAAEELQKYKRIYTVTAPAENAEALAVCAMADVVAAIAAAQCGTGSVASASIGSVSVSYGNGAAMDLSLKGQAKELYAAAQRYLDIYRGVSVCGL